ncbi:MAG: AAA family ATPase [Candidatus Omnitrophica bacterium]|nr:AAA family ATPase [Candidatus Omnitrophota bacterium]
MAEEKTTPDYQKEIDILIRARYPILYVVSFEEERVLELFSDLAAPRNKEIFVWTVTGGIAKYDEPAKADSSTADPLAALNFIDRQNNPAIFILKDFHPFMTDHTIIRKLRDLIYKLKSTYATLVIVSPVLSVPAELEKDIVMVEFDLPGKEELGRLMDEIVEAVSKSHNVKIDIEGDVRDKLITAALGLTLNEAENAFARAIVVDKCLGPEDVDKILTEKEQVIRKSGILEYYRTNENIKNVGGLELLKDWINKRSLAFSDKAKDFGLPRPKGILLIGVQGCGKSLTCKSIASLWKMPLLRFDVGRVFSGIVGSSEENMRRAIKAAESVAPVILWIDEIEKSLSGVQSSNFSDAGTSARVFSTFLTWLQEKTKPVFVVATANNIDMLPPELLRKGRFDEIFFVDLPSLDERKEIFSIHIDKRKRDSKNFNLDLLAQESEGFSGAEIEQAVISGLFEAFVSGADLTTADISKDLKSTVPLSKTMRERVEVLRSWAKTRARPASSDDAKPHKSSRKIEL